MIVSALDYTYQKKYRSYIDYNIFQSMVVVYALVARENFIIAERSGNFQLVARTVLSRIPNDRPSTSYTCDIYQFYCLRDGGFIFMCMTEEEDTSSSAECFLQEMLRVWSICVEAEGDAMLPAARLPLLKYDAIFTPSIKHLMEVEYIESATHDPLEYVRTEVRQLKAVVINNIESLLERGEKLDVLVDKSDKLTTQSRSFERSSHQLKQRTYWSLFRRRVLIALTLVLIAAMAVVGVCVRDFDRCKL